MTAALPTFRLVTACVHAIPTLVWAIIMFEFWRIWRARRSRSTLYLVLFLLSGAFTLHLLLDLLIDITPNEAGLPPNGLHAPLEGVVGLLSIAMGPLLLHAVVLLPVRAEPPSRRWLAATYGSGVVIAAACVFLFWRRPEAPGDPWLAPGVISFPYLLLMCMLGLRHAFAFARRGAWRQGPAVVELRSPDLIVLTVSLLVGAVMLFLLVAAGAASLASTGTVLLHTAVSLGFAVPLAVRMLGRVVHGFLTMAILGAATLLVFFGSVALAARMPDPDLARLVGLAGVAALLLILIPGRSLVRSAIDRLVFHRGQLRQVELLAAVRELSPELGIEECCRRALDSVARVMRFRGAAILLTRDRGTFVLGDLDLAALSSGWPDDAATKDLPTRPVMEAMLRELPPDVRDALIAADVSRLATIASPRQRWGYLFATEALLSGPLTEVDVDALYAYLSQLALLLDGAELLERAVAVERSLAHAEKLAAIGELTARIAHEIRNPLTAARSLAQQLAHERGDLEDEHRAILEALERVERRVAELLRFARRDELQRSDVDLAGLVRSTVADLGPRLDQAGVRVAIEEVPVVGRLDAEKIRQVLVNLIENARDALQDASGERRLVIAVGNSGGRGRLEVRDSGPGVAPEVLPRLFDPFFTSKPAGTGLGLAIVKRIVEAHGGEISAGNAPGGGLLLTIDLPLRGIA